MAPDTQRALRATLEDCIFNQEKIMEKLDSLITDNRKVYDSDERKEMFRLMARSCLGCEGKIPFNTMISGKKLDWPHVGYAFGRVVYLTENGKDKELDGLNMADLWKSLLNHLLIVFPQARYIALARSPERYSGEDMVGVRE